MTALQLAGSAVIVTGALPCLNKAGRNKEAGKAEVIQPWQHVWSCCCPLRACLFWTSPFPCHPRVLRTLVLSLCLVPGVSPSVVLLPYATS